jgi:hypothetical protein
VGCEYIQESDDIVVSDSDLTISAPNTNDIVCTGDADGGVNFSLSSTTGATDTSFQVFRSPENVDFVVGGTAGNPADKLPSGNMPVDGATHDITGLAPGKYYVVFTELDGTKVNCIQTSEIFTITEPAKALELNATNTKNDNNCSEAGTITAMAQFGSGAYKYILKLQTEAAPGIAEFDVAGVNTTGFFSDKAHGDYTVYARDDSGCIRNQNVTIGLDPSPEISVALDNTCSGTEGNYNIVVSLDSPGMPPYQLKIDGGAPQTVNTFPHTVQNLSSGTHRFEIVDFNGCGEATPDEIEILPRLQFNATVTKLLDCS